ncbi:hypothetical protein FRB91_011678 [Serendipita sp. 411]|nr:hypothetical protein FRB91_011678 [Serendipita sp. 411]
MRFLDLPEDIFIEIFAHLEQEWYSVRNEAFQSLRLTCKALSVLAEPAVFAALDIRLEGTNLETLASQSSKFGVHARRLTLDLIADNTEKEWIEQLAVPTRDKHLSIVLSNLSALRDLTIHILCLTTTTTTTNANANANENEGILPQTVSALSALQRVERLRVIEGTGATKIWSLKRINTLTNHVIQALLKSSGPVLKSLSVDSMSVMSPDTFDLLRSTASNLRSLVLRNFFGIECRAMLSEEKTWACRETLRKLQFHDCRGAHAGAIASGLSTGAWTKYPLDSLEVSKCGDHDDFPSAPYQVLEANLTTSSTTFPTGSNNDTTPTTTTKNTTTNTTKDMRKRNANVIEKAHYEHEFDWEMQLLGLLPVKHVTVTKTPSSLILYMLEHDLFPGMETLDLIEWKEGAPDSDTYARIETACTKRRVTLLHSAEEIVACSCPYGS